MKICIIGFFALLFCSFQSDSLPKEFSELLERANMVFRVMDGFHETKPIQNSQMNYEFAVMNKNKDFEIRYAIRPLDNLIKEYEELERKKKPGDANVNPNNYYPITFQATVMNISGGTYKEPSIFDKTSVNNEFNADWGASTFIEVGKDFGQEYKYCMIVALHKKNVADAYLFFLTYKKEIMENNINKVFYTIKFK
jgi:hypothetical protein